MGTGVNNMPAYSGCNAAPCVMSVLQTPGMERYGWSAKLARSVTTEMRTGFQP